MDTCDHWLRGHRSCCWAASGWWAGGPRDPGQRRAGTRRWMTEVFHNLQDCLRSQAASLPHWPAMKIIINEQISLLFQIMILHQDQPPSSHDEGEFHCRVATERVVPETTEVLHLLLPCLQRTRERQISENNHCWEDFNYMLGQGKVWLWKEMLFHFNHVISKHFHFLKVLSSTD